MTGAALTRVAAAVTGVCLLMANRAELTAGRVPPDHALEARIDALVAPLADAGRPGKPPAAHRRTLKTRVTVFGLRRDQTAWSSRTAVP